MGIPKHGDVHVHGLTWQAASSSDAIRGSCSSLENLSQTTCSAARQSKRSQSAPPFGRDSVPNELGNIEQMQSATRAAYDANQKRMTASHLIANTTVSVARVLVQNCCTGGISNTPCLLQYCRRSRKRSLICNLCTAVMLWPASGSILATNCSQLFANA